MADEGSRKYNVGPPQKKPLVRTPGQKAFFFLDDKLYKVLQQNRGLDLLSAWDFEREKIVQFLLTDVKKKMKPAFDTVEVAQMLNRRREVVQSYVFTGKINSPMRIYEKGMNSQGHKFTKMKWSQDDILALHEYLTTVGAGRPRKDGILRQAARVPSRRELLAMMRQQPLFYMQTADGEFVPVWMANNEV